ncbi:hypothetical protein PENTCL1PPCAC_8900, partial [Pristionchus entomophagus]
RLQEIRDELSSISIFSEENLINGDMMHAIDKFSMRKHYILNLSTNMWTEAGVRGSDCYISEKAIIICDGALYAFARWNSDNHDIVYRFDDGTKRWIKMLSSKSSWFPAAYGSIETIGSRVYLSSY